MTLRTQFHGNAGHAYAAHRYALLVTYFLLKAQRLLQLAHGGIQFAFHLIHAADIAQR